MPKRSKKRSYILAATVAVLMLLSFITGILASELLLKTGNDIPTTDIVINVGNDTSGSENGGAETNDSANTENTESTESTNQTESNDSQGSTPQPTEPPKNPGAIVEDAEGQWNGNASVGIFKAYYDENGDINVKSAYGDKVIAPGTANSYYFDIKNTGDTPIYYTVKTEAILTFTVNGETLSVPVEARFRNHDGQYLLGSENSFADFGKLNGLEDRGGLSVNHYVRYTLEWQWPFEGNDELDTLIGNLAAEGDVISVSVKINVTASEDINAVGGNPQTGDNSNIGLWITLCIVSFFMLFILIFVKRREREVEAECK